MESVEEILEQFPKKTEGLQEGYKSFVFQPNRLSINSRQFLTTQNRFIYQYNLNGMYYNTFSSQLRTPVLGLKSLELIRATIPNAVLNIPNDETVFYYYKINNEGTPNFEPDVVVDISNVRMVRLLPSNSYRPLDFETPSEYGWNRTFSSYQDLVVELNKAAINDPDSAALTAAGLYNTGDITFFYDEVQNKIGFRGNNYITSAPPLPANRPNFYYSVVGWNDEYLGAAQALLKTTLVARFAALNLRYTAAPLESNGQYTLARRLGFLWTGLPANSGSSTLDEVETFLDNLVPQNAYNPASLPWDPYINLYADSFADLVYSSNLFLYCDVVGGGTQDTNIDERLLAVIPMNATNQGVVFGESKIPCELSKVSGEIYSLNFIMRTDTAKPFQLPVNAYVNLELKLNY